MGSVEVRGAEQLAEVGKRIKTADATVLRQELRRNLRAVVKPIKPLVQASLRAGLPKKGHLNTFMGNASVGARVRTEGRDVGVRIVAGKKGHNLRKLDEGEIRHPTFGHKPWKKQAVTPGLVSKPIEAEKPAMQRAVMDAVNATAKKITD